MSLERRVSKLEEHSENREPEELIIHYAFYDASPDGPVPTGEEVYRRFVDGELVEERRSEATERQPDS